MPIGRKKKSPNLGSQSLTAGSYRPTPAPQALKAWGAGGLFCVWMLKSLEASCTAH